MLSFWAPLGDCESRLDPDRSISEPEYFPDLDFFEEPDFDPFEESDCEPDWQTHYRDFSDDVGINDDLFDRLYEPPVLGEPVYDEPEYFLMGDEEAPDEFDDP